MITAVALTFVVNVATAVFKWLFVKVGRVGTQAIVFVLACVAALFIHFDFFTADIKTYLMTAGAVFSAAVALYEVVLSRFAFFQGPQE